MPFNFSMLDEPQPVGTTGQQPSASARNPAPVDAGTGVGFNFSMLQEPAQPPSDLERVVLGQPPAPKSATMEVAGNIAGLPGQWLASKLPDWLRQASDALVAPALRVTPAVGGGVLGGVLGGPVGAAIGGGLGAGAGETGAEALEVQTGAREALNPVQIAAQTALGAVPVVGRAGSVPAAVASRGVQGAALGGGGSVATDLAEGREIDLKQAAIGAGVGAALGGVGGAVEARAASKVARNADDLAPKPNVAPKPETDGFDFSMLDEANKQPPSAPTTFDRRSEAARSMSRGDFVQKFGKSRPDEVRIPLFEVQEKGNPGIRVEPLEKPRLFDQPSEPHPFQKAVVFRDENGQARGVLQMHLDPQGQPGVPVVWVDPAFRRQGIATQLYAEAERAGFRLTQSGDALTPDGAALFHSRANKATEAAAPPRPQGVNEAELPPGGAEVPRSGRVPQDNIPAQKPLPEARKAGDQTFIDHQPEPFREGLKEIVEKNDHYEAQRRGVQPVERTNALAQWVQVERARALPSGTALNAEQLKAYADNIATVTDRIDDLSKKILDGSATFADQAALTAARHEQGVLLASAFGARAETGRALNIHKQFAQIFESKDAQAIREAMKIEGVDPTEVARKLAELPTDAAKLEYIRSLQQRTWGQMARGLYFSNILSGVRTHVRNVLGNTANGIFNNTANVAAVGYDAARSAATGKQRTIFLSELKPRAVGAALGVQQGIDDALFTLQNGYTPTQLRTFDVPRPELPGGGKNPLNWVGRSLEAEDQLFFSINYNSELFARLHARARSEALKKGLTGKAADDLILDRMTEWKLSPPPVVAESARLAAQRAVFKEEPGKVVGALLNLKREAPVLDFVMPFVRTPANILRQGIEATPLAPVTKQTRAALKAGGRESAEAVGRMVTGTVALSALAFVASQGKLSGAGPRDPEKRAALMESGWRPYSVMAGDKWISYTDFIQPLAQPMFAIANAYDRYLEGEQVTPDAVAGKAGEALLDQSFLAGVSDFFRAMSDWDRHGEQFVQRVSQGAIPASGMARNIAQAIDPVVREPKTLIEGVKAVTPGLSKTVTPKLDRFGKEVEREGSPVVRGLSPVNIGTVSKDHVIQELMRLKVDDLGLPPKKLPEAGSSPAIELTVEERKRMGAAVRQELERLLQNPGFKNLDADVARERIKIAAARGRRRVSQEIRNERRSTR